MAEAEIADSSISSVYRLALNNRANEATHGAAVNLFGGFVIKHKTIVGQNKIISWSFISFIFLPVDELQF